MQSGGRKRVVSSCIPCYRKKQKVRVSHTFKAHGPYQHVANVAFGLAQCNRHYPCNHCTRRRQPEECIYHPLQASETPHAENRAPGDAPPDHDAQSQDTRGNNEPVGASSDWSRRRDLTVAQGGDSLAELFGYFEHGESNTMALVRRVSTFCVSLRPCAKLRQAHLYRKFLIGARV